MKRKYQYHGSYAKMDQAVERQKAVGGIIRERKIEGKTRFFVLSVKEEK
jgi:hypothetical protein